MSGLRFRGSRVHLGRSVCGCGGIASLGGVQDLGFKVDRPKKGYI